LLAVYRFSGINPNSRIPVVRSTLCPYTYLPGHQADRPLSQIVDHDRRGVKIWESGSIYLYLARHYDINYALHFEDDDEEDAMVGVDFGAAHSLLGTGSLEVSLNSPLPLPPNSTRGSSSATQASPKKEERSGSSSTLNPSRLPPLGLSSPS
jgi:hypothetical protein